MERNSPIVRTRARDCGGGAEWPAGCRTCRLRVIGPVGCAVDRSIGNRYDSKFCRSSITVRCRSARWAGIPLSGHSSTGARLSSGSRIYMKDVSTGENEGTIFSVTLSGLSSGENVVEIVVTAEDETTRSYRLVAKRSGGQ